MRALVLNCTLKPSPAPSNTQALADVVISALREQDVEVETVRVVDRHIPPGVETDQGGGDEWPELHAALMASDGLVIASPTWLGQPSSVAKLVLERMDAMISEKKDDGTYAAYNKVAGIVCTGNEDGAHHVITEIAARWSTSDSRSRDRRGRTGTWAPVRGLRTSRPTTSATWSESTGRTMAANLVAAARALQAHPLPPPG